MPTKKDAGKGTRGRGETVDPATADGLSPRDLAIGCKRPILHTDYYEAFNLEHVSLVDLRRGGITEYRARRGSCDRCRSAT